MLENGILIKNLNKYYGSNHVLKDISLQILAGKIYGLLGRNGAGKSTLMNILTQKIFLNSGEIYINGVSLESADLSQLFMICDDPVFFKGAKVKEVFSFFSKVSKSFDYESAKYWINAFHLSMNMKVGQMSTGQSTLLKNTLALSMNVPYLLLDEPVLGLDASHREMFYNALLKEYIKNPQRTIILSSHLIEEISDLIQEVIIIKEGQLLLQSSVDDLSTRGYSVTGYKDDIQAYKSIVPKDKILDEDILGTLVILYIWGDIPQNQLDSLSCANRLNFDSISLQKLFIKLTESDMFGE